MRPQPTERPINATPASRSAAREEMELVLLEIQTIDAQLADRNRSVRGQRQHPHDYFTWRTNTLARKTKLSARYRFLKGWLHDQNTAGGGGRKERLEVLASAVAAYLADGDDTDETYQGLVDAYDALEQGAA